MDRIDGPAPPEEKAVWKALIESGVEENRIPAQFQNSVVARSKRDKLGQIVVKRMTGVENSTAKRVVQQFEKNIGGVDDLTEKLQAIREELSPTQSRLLEVLEAGSSRKSLARLMAETQVAPISIMHAYARGAIELGKVNAAIEAHKNLPAVAEELVKMALSRVGVCGACGGSGKLHKTSVAHEDSDPCIFCKKGLTQESKHKQFAIEKVLEMTGQTSKAPMVQVAVGVKVGSDKSSIFERMMKATDEVLYKRDPVVDPVDVVEGEVSDAS